LKDLNKPMCHTFTFGPLIAPFGAVPKRPTGGALKAVGSNQRLIDC
jgi:hypothetical protein